MRLLILILLALSFWPASPAVAACTSPAGNAGYMMYNADYAVMQFCDGVSWISMAASGALTELDPKIGTLTANNFCTINAGGTVIVCATAAINLASQVTGKSSRCEPQQRDECRQLPLLARGWNLGDDQHGSSHADIGKYLGR